MSDIIAGNFQWKSNGGPRNHPSGSWKLSNAWDLESRAGNDVFSAVNGMVTEKQSPSTPGHLYGTSITIRGEGSYPTIFYSNLSSVNVNIGSQVRVGDKLGEIANAPAGTSPYIHIALPIGKDITSIISNNGSFVSPSGSSSGVEDAAVAAGAAGAAGATALASGDGKKDSGDGGSFMDKFYGTLTKGLLPFGLVTGVAGMKEEVERIKELMK